jgi:hypothetical protein
MTNMKTKMLLAAMCIAAAIGGLQAAPVVVASPDKANVMVFSEILNQNLHWNAGTHTLIAGMTFSNLNYVSRTEARQDQDVYFNFPGVRYDQASGTFYKSGSGIPLATAKPGLFGSEITLAPGARIITLDDHGKLTAMLVAGRDPVIGSHWVRVQDDAALQRMFASARHTRIYRD